MKFWPGVIIQRWIVTPGHNSTLNCDPGHDSTLIVAQIKISRWIVTPGHDSTLNCDPGSWFHVELWHQFKLWSGIGITIQCGILTRGHNSTWNLDPVSQFNVEFWPVYISSTRGIAIQEGVKIQQRDQYSIAKLGHNSTKNPLNIDPGSVFHWGGGQNFMLHRR